MPRSTIKGPQDGAITFNEGSADVDFRVESDGNANMFFVDAGNNRVGVGTSSPSSALHVDSSDDGPIFDSGGTGNTNHALLVRDSGNNQLLRVDNNGNTGVGTSSPSQALHVSASNPFFELQGTASTSGDTGIFLNANANHWILKADNYSSTNAFQIKQGDTSSSTAFMTINSIGAVTKPLQPAFLANGSSGNDDMTAGSVATVVFGTEVYDQNSDFASNTFTAPVDGKYLLIGTFLFTDVDTDCSEIEIRINTSNRIHRLFIVPSKQLSADGSIGDSLSVVADMDANDTAIIQVTPANGANQMNIHPYTFFSGCLLA